MNKLVQDICHNVDGDPVVYATFARTTWRPYRGSHIGGGDGYIAVAIPGGHAGCGRTPEDACRMALGRNVSSYLRAHRGGISFDAWYKRMCDRVTPAMNDLLADIEQDKADTIDLHLDNVRVNLKTANTPRLARLARRDLVPQQG